MSEFPHLLLKKWATTGSLSQNMFCQLLAKGNWLTILESLKKKNKHGQRLQPLTKQTWCSYKLKRIHICGVHLGLLPQTSPGGFHLLSSISISTCSGKALALGWPGLHRIYAYIFNSWRICTQVLYSSLLTCMESMPAYSIPGVYVHKWPWCFDLRGSPWWKTYYGEWLVEECIGDLQGSLLGNFDLRGSLCWCVVHWRNFSSTPWGNFFTTLERVVLVP